MNIKQRKPAYKPQTKKTETTMRTLRETKSIYSTWEIEKDKISKVNDVHEDLVTGLTAEGEST